MTTFGQDEGIAARANVLVEMDPVGDPGHYLTIGCIINTTPPPVSREIADDEPCMNFEAYPDWVAQTAYFIGDRVQNVGQRYVAATDGVSGATTGPTHTSGTETDGSVDWTYLGPVTAADFTDPIPCNEPGEMSDSEFLFTTVWVPGSDTVAWLESAVQSGTKYKWKLQYSNGNNQLVDGWIRESAPQQGNQGSGKWKTDVTVVVCGPWEWEDTIAEEAAEPEAEGVAEPVA